MRTVRLLTITLFAAIAMLAAACGDDDGGASDPTGTPLDTPNATVVQGGLPDGFPEDFPTFDPSTLIRGREEDGIYAIEWQTDSPGVDVVAFYTSALDTAPFATTNIESSDPGVAVIDFENADGGYTGQLGIGVTGPGGARILLNLTTEN